MLSNKASWFSTTVMRAVVVNKFGGSEVLEIKRNVPIPKPKENEVLVKVAAVGVNPVDVYIRSGNYSKLPTLPYIPGNDVCGTVVHVGGDVKNYQEGDRVCSFRTSSGAYGEYTSICSKYLIKLPEDYDFVKGAAVGTPYLTAYRALIQKANFKPGQTILIHGASGGVGMAATQLAISKGMNVIGTAGTEEGMKMVRENGVKYVFNHREEGYASSVMSATGGQGVDGIIEMLSNVNLARDLDMLAPKGMVLVVGSRGSIEINPRAMMGRETNIQGVALGSSPDEDLREASLAVEVGLKQGWLNPVIGPKYSLNDVQQAHEDIIHNTGSKGKMVLII
ncbi:quinone oxidoreductase-like [Styela clava]